MVITRVKNVFPDMIMTAFDVKFQGKKNGMPPGACRPLKKLKHKHLEKVDLYKVEKTMSKKWIPTNGFSKVDSLARI